MVPELPRDVLWSDRPAADWEADGYPIGNGRMGAMVLAGADADVLTLNDEGLWDGRPGFDNAAAGVPDDAFDTSADGFGGYRSAGVLWIGLDRTGLERRELDLRDGVHRAIGGGVHREVFASAAADAIIVRLTAEAPASVTATIALWSDQADAPTHVDGAALAWSGALANGVQHAGRIDAVADGARVEVVAIPAPQQPFADGTTAAPAPSTAIPALRVVGAREVVLVVDVRTAWGGDAAPHAPEALRANGDRLVLAPRAHVDASSLLAAHTARHRAVMDAVDARWGDSLVDVLALPTERRIARTAAGGADPSLEQTLLVLSRYLLLASAAPSGVLPPTLQGIWNRSNQPPWACDPPDSPMAPST